MIVDSSKIVSILMSGTDAHTFADAPARFEEPVLMSAATFFKCSILVDRDGGQFTSTSLDGLDTSLPITVEASSTAQAAVVGSIA